MSEVLASLIVKIGADIKDYSDGLKQATSQLAQISRTMEDAGRNMTALITLPMIALGAAAIETAAKFEQTSIAFTHFLGSVQSSRAFLGDLYNFAATTPFQIKDITSGAQALMAMGFAAKDIIPDLRVLGDQLSAVGRTENLQPIILAFGEMKAKGVASMKEIRQMVTDGVIPAVKYLAEGLGITETEVFEKLKSKAIDSGTAIKLIMAGMAKDTGGMMTEQMSSFTGLMSNLKDKITLSLKDIGDSLLPLAKDLVSMASGAIAAIEGVARAFGQLPVPVQESIIVATALVAAIGPAVLALGFMASAVRSVIALWPVLAAGGNAAAVMLTGTLEPALLAVASTLTLAFAGLTIYAIGRWAYDQVPGVKALGDGIANMIASIPGIQKLIDYLSTGSEHAQLQAQVDKAVLALKEHNVVIQQGSLSLTDYAAKLRVAMAGLTDNTGATDKAAAAARDLMILNGQNTAALDAAEKALTNVRAAYKLHAASAADVAAAEEAVRKALAAVHPEYDAGAAAATKLSKALEAARTSLALVTEANRMGLASHRDVRLATEQVTAAFQAANPEFTKWWTVTDQTTLAMRRLEEIIHPVKDLVNPLTAMFQQMALDEQRIKDATTEMNTAFAATPALLSPLMTMMSSAIKDVNAWTDAFATLGITSSSTLKKQAADALAAYNTIRASGASSAHDIEEAWVAMEKARQAAAVAADQTITASEKLALASAETALGQHIKTIKGDWMSAVTSIKQSIESDLSRAIGDLIFRVNSIGAAFKALAQNIVQSIVGFVITQGIELLIAKIVATKTASSAAVGVQVAGYGVVSAAAIKSAASQTAAATGTAAAQVAAFATISAAAISAMAAQMAVNVLEIFSYAAVAAAAAFASTCAIPIVGPELAPAAAIAAWGATAAYAPMASFDKGGFIPEDMIAQVHKGEYVLTAAEMNSMARGGGGNPALALAGGGHAFNFYGIQNPADMAEAIVANLKLRGVKF